MKTYTFDATIIGHGQMNAAFIEFPFDVEKEFGTRGWIKVRATFDGFEYRGSLAKMDHHCHFLIMTQAVRKAIGKQPGDSVHVTIQKDDQSRTVEVPEDFRKKLNENPEVQAFFDGLAFTHRKEYIRWITEAKRPETRERRINKAIEMLTGKQKFS